MPHHSVVDVNWFKGRLLDRSISQRKLAKHLGLDPAAISLMINGRRKASAKEIAEIARLLGASSDEVLTRLGAGVPAKRSSGGGEAVAATSPPSPAFGGAIGSDAEFLMRWMELGNYLLSRR